MMLCAHSYYVTPTVLTDVTDDMDIWKEEVFGPVRHPPIQSKWLLHTQRCCLLLPHRCFASGPSRRRRRGWRWLTTATMALVGGVATRASPSPTAYQLLLTHVWCPFTAAAVFTADKDRMQRVTRALEVGIVWNNCSQPCFCQMPW